MYERNVLGVDDDQCLDMGQSSKAYGPLRGAKGGRQVSQMMEVKLAKWLKK